MAKSEINVLQELSIKHGFIPIYNFTDKRIDATNMQFTCNVRYKEFNVYGTGNSKKEAKHNAAKNMLSLLATNNQISLPVATSSLDANMLHITSPAKVHKISPLKQLTIETIDRNYIGLLQEFCQQQKISARDILYEVVDEEGPQHMRIFTIEVSVGPLKERATAHCKKTAKQEAARKLLLHLDPNIANSNRVNLHTANQNIDKTNLLLDHNKLDIHKKTLENIGVGELDCMIKETLPVAELSEKAKLLYLECTDKNEKIDQTDPFAIKNVHMLFEKNYSSKIPYSTKEKMRIVRDRRIEQITLMHEIKQDIENSLKVKIQQFSIPTMHNEMKNHLVCLRLLSHPRITQFGIGETKFIAESRAMSDLVSTILTFLNI